jgi:F-type H+-transporting ATPase subunit epsilon
MLNVRIVSPDGVLFEGAAGSVVLPGEAGTFEVLPLHRPLASRLRGGVIEVDERRWPIRRGAVSVADDVVTAVVETE